MTHTLQHGDTGWACTCGTRHGTLLTWWEALTLHQEHTAHHTLLETLCQPATPTPEETP